MPMRLRPARRGRSKPAPCRYRRSTRTKPSWDRGRRPRTRATAADIDTVLVSVGGGGLIAGIAAWYAGRIKVVGVEPLASPTLTKAFEAGHPVDAEAGGLAADRWRRGASANGCFRSSRICAANRAGFRRRDRGMRRRQLWRGLRIVAEPGGAAAFSAILSGAYNLPPASGSPLSSAAATLPR